jgi:hypothetical protein
MNDERLRQILRQGDPAGGDGGLTPDEARAMRRTVLAAVPERKRRLLPIFALAGAMATAVLIAVLLWKPEPVKAPVPPRIAAAPPVARVPVQPVPQPPPQEREERRPAQRHPSQHRHRRPAPPAAPKVNDTLASLETVPAETTERQVQLTAPGGTRIIWILKSGKASR